MAVVVVNVVAVVAFFSYVLIVVEVRRITGILLGQYEVLRRLRHYLRAQSLRHHAIDGLEEADVERGSARRSSLKGRERAIVNQTNTGTVLKATLGET